MGRNPNTQRYFRRRSCDRWHYYRTVPDQTLLDGCFSATDTWNKTGWTLESVAHYIGRHGDMSEINKDECPYLDRPTVKYGT